MFTRVSRRRMLRFALLVGLVSHAGISAGTGVETRLEERSSVRGGIQNRVGLLPAGVHALESTVSGTGYRDLEGLDDLVSSARLVGIGEATHGTREFETMQWRLMEYLAERHGFRLFLMEDDLIRVEKLDGFVVDGVGDPYRLATEGYDWGQEWGKSVQERVELLLRAREFNRGRDDPIRFAGFDAKLLGSAMDAVVSTLGPLDPELADEIEERYSQFRDLDEGNVARRPANASFALEAPEAIPGRVELSGWIRTEGVERGWAGLVLRVEDGEKQALAVETMGETAPTDTTPWRRYEVSVVVPEGTGRLVVGVYSVGTGTAWFDDLRVTIDGDPLGTEEDLSFDSLEGLWIHAPSHEVEQGAGRIPGEGGSLRIRCRPTEIDEALDEARAIVEELRSSARLRASAPSPDAGSPLDRVVRYARMVIQALEFRDLHAARDRAMADNVRWWLDRYPPGTRAVVVAANSHVARMGTRIGKLGDHLADRYGDEYVPIAMTTYSGTYLAEGEEGPAIHRLPEAPEGSLEALLHEYEMPILLVDFDRLDPGSDLARILSEPIPRRGIGLTHRENQFAPADLPKQYDALFFLDTTVHTRLLPGAGR